MNNWMMKEAKQSWYLQKVEFPINLDKGEVCMDIKSCDPFWTNQTIETSKLVSYTLAQLI